MNNNVVKHDTYFLEDNTEVKIILTTMPHYKIFIRNENGKLVISEASYLENDKYKETSQNND